MGRIIVPRRQLLMPSGLAFDKYGTKYESLVHCEGVDGSQVLTDSNRGRGNWTAKGANSRISTAASKFGASSIYCNGTSTVGFNTPPFLATGDSFCIEAYLCPLSYTNSAGGSSSASALCGQGGNGGSQDQGVRILDNSIGYFRGSPLGGAVDMRTDYLPLGVFTHFALTYDGAHLRIFLDGRKEAEVADTVGWYNTGQLFTLGYEVVSGYSTWAWYFNGYIDEFRVTTFDPVYVDSFTPPTKPFEDGRTVLLAHMDGPHNSTIFTDVKRGALSRSGDIYVSQDSPKIGIANAWSGGGAYLDRSAVNDFVFAQDDFTIETWVNTGKPGSPQTIMDKLLSYANGNCDFRVEANSAGQIGFLGGPNVNWVFGNPSTEYPANQWFHLAIQRMAGVNALFIDGQQRIENTNSYNIGNKKNSLRIGAGNNSSPNNYFSGRLDEVRVTSRVARYSSNFTPSLKPFPDNVTA